MLGCMQSGHLWCKEIEERADRADRHLESSERGCTDTCRTVDPDNDSVQSEVYYGSRGVSLPFGDGTSS